MLYQSKEYQRRLKVREETKVTRTQQKELERHEAKKIRAQKKFE